MNSKLEIQGLHRDRGMKYRLSILNQIKLFIDLVVKIEDKPISTVKDFHQTLSNYSGYSHYSKLTWKVFFPEYDNLPPKEIMEKKKEIFWRLVTSIRAGIAYKWEREHLEAVAKFLDDDYILRVAEEAHISNLISPRADILQGKRFWIYYVVEPNFLLSIDGLKKSRIDIVSLINASLTIYDPYSCKDKVYFGWFSFIRNSFDKVQFDFDNGWKIFAELDISENGSIEYSFAWISCEDIKYNVLMEEIKDEEQDPAIYNYVGSVPCELPPELPSDIEISEHARFVLSASYYEIHGMRRDYQQKKDYYRRLLDASLDPRTSPKDVEFDIPPDPSSPENNRPNAFPPSIFIKLPSSYRPDLRLKS